MPSSTASKTRTLVTTALMAAVIAVLSPFTIPVGPIPFTLGVFAVALCGALLPPLAACASLGVYILLGAIGLPVFSGFRAGPQVLVGATGGYIVGYFCLALALALAVRHTKSLPLQVAAGVVGMAACYLLGTLWYAFVSGAGFVAGLAVCVAPFALPDLIKIAAATALGQVLLRRLNRRPV